MYTSFGKFENSKTICHALSENSLSGIIWLTNPELSASAAVNFLLNNNNSFALKKNKEKIKIQIFDKFEVVFTLSFPKILGNV